MGSILVFNVQCHFVLAIGHWPFDSIVGLCKLQMASYTTSNNAVECKSVTKRVQIFRRQKKKRKIEIAKARKRVKSEE